MWKSINTIAYFKVDPTVDMDRVHEVVFFDEIYRDVAQFDVDILGAVQRYLEVKILYVKSDKLGAFMGNDAVEHEFDVVKGSGICSDAAGISDFLACNSDASAIGIGILGTKGTNNL